MPRDPVIVGGQYLGTAASIVQASDGSELDCLNFTPGENVDLPAGWMVVNFDADEVVIVDHLTGCRRLHRDTIAATLARIREA